MVDQHKKFVILVGASPYTHQAADSALVFARAVIEKGHLIEQVFFYFDGVYLASNFAAPEQSERKITSAWSEFAEQNNLDLVVCSNSALKRGMLDQQHAQAVGKSGDNIHPAFTLAGLGQFVEASSKADRVITFAA